MILTLLYRDLVEGFPFGRGVFTIDYMLENY